jgi:exoribonuclease R
MTAFAIDDPSTVVVDDAVSLETLSDGTELIHIHIADPERLFELGSETGRNQQLPLLLQFLLLLFANSFSFFCNPQHFVTETHFQPFLLLLQDSVARRHTSTIYLPNQHFPMLPNSLVSQASLEGGKSNYTLTFTAKLAQDGSLSDFNITPSIVNQLKRVSYQGVDDILTFQTPTGKL